MFERLKISGLIVNCGSITRSVAFAAEIREAVSVPAVASTEETT